jgi:adenylate cyclase
MPESWTNEDFRQILTGEHPGFATFRNNLKRIPSSPRCKLCNAPFGGPGGAVMKHFGFGRFPGNPAICQNCISQYRKMGVTGAEIPVTLLFADIRGSTGIGERLSPTGFHDFLVHFYRLGSAAILDNGGIIDKLVGDEVIGLFFGGISGPRHAAAGIAAATELVARAGRADATPMGSIPIGAGIHTGIAYVGPTGPEGTVDDFTALGDAVNTTARLASAAAAGELLVSVDAAEAAGVEASDAERRTLDVRGREATIDVVVLHPGA